MSLKFKRGFSGLESLCMLVALAALAMTSAAVYLKMQAPAPPTPELPQVKLIDKPPPDSSRTGSGSKPTVAPE